MDNFGYGSFIYVNIYRYRRVPTGFGGAEKLKPLILLGRTRKNGHFCLFFTYKIETQDGGGCGK